MKKIDNIDKLNKPQRIAKKSSIKPKTKWRRGVEVYPPQKN